MFENEKIEKLERLLEMPVSCNFYTDIETGDSILLIKAEYNIDDCVEINFNELLILLKNYVNIDKIILD